MKKIVIPRAGGQSVMQIEEHPKPQPKEGEVLVKVRAAGLNFADIMARQGLYQDAPPFPCTVGYEVSGTVEDAGAGVETGWIGKDVFGLTRFQGQSEYVCIPAVQCFDKPSKFTHEQAAAIPVNYLTAFVLLDVMGSLKKHETLLVQNAGGGVGIAALQIAKQIGARVIGTASPGKHDRLRKLGYDGLIDYRQDDWEKHVMHLTHGKGVELIIDPLGPQSWKKGYKLLRHTGRIGLFGASELSGGGGFMKAFTMLKTAASMPLFSPLTMLNMNRGVFGVNMGHLWHEPQMVRIWMREVMKGIDSGAFTPVIDSVFKFDDVARAHAQLEERKNFGKVILVP